MSGKCKFRNKDGSRCAADVQTGLDVCVFHDPAKVKDGCRARRAGGIKRSCRATVLPSDTPDHPLTSPNEVVILLADSINQLRRGQLDPRVANGVGYLSTVLLRALEQGPLEERMAEIEATLRRGRGEPPIDTSEGKQ